MKNQTAPIEKNGISLFSKSDSELLDLFFNIELPETLSKVLEIKHSLLTFLLYKTSPLTRYYSFQIPKKSGGKREITAPNKTLKILQRKLNHILNLTTFFRPCVHGFTKDKSIVTNASAHKKSRYILNIDLKDFFPSINYGRVFGMFRAAPFRFNQRIASILANICCHNNQLPQGAPTSPIVSNLICWRLDGNLQRLARENKCYYTRYADDITFSTNSKSFPKDIIKYSSPDADIYRNSSLLDVEYAVKNWNYPEDIADMVALGENKNLIFGENFLRIMTRNGFRINYKKIRLQNKSCRQAVTGLTINEKVNVKQSYIRNIRAMVHKWDVSGLQSAEAEFFEKYNTKNLSPSMSKSIYDEVLRGKLSFLKMVRGAADTRYRFYVRQYNNLPGAKLIYLPDIQKEKFVFGEKEKNCIMELGITIQKLITSINSLYYATHNEEYLFSHNEKFQPTLIKICSKQICSESIEESTDALCIVVNALYILFYESSGAKHTRLANVADKRFSSLTDINDFRYWADHVLRRGKNVKENIARAQNIFMKYTGKKIAEQLEPIDFYHLQEKLYANFIKDLKEIESILKKR